MMARRPASRRLRNTLTDTGWSWLVLGAGLLVAAAIGYGWL